MRRSRAKDYKHLRSKRSPVRGSYADESRPSILTIIWAYLNELTNKIPRFFAIKSMFILVFVLIGLRFASLQLQPIASSSSQDRDYSYQVIPARRGQIYLRDMLRSNADIALTSSTITADIFFDGKLLNRVLELEQITLDEAAQNLASIINVPYSEVKETLEAEIQKENPSQYSILKKGASGREIELIINLKSQRDIIKEQKLNYSWVGYDQDEKRLYPENTLAASTIGYLRPSLATENDALNAGCRTVVEENENRGTVWNRGYYVGYYGLEQTYCDLLSGINGRQVFTQDLGTQKEKEAVVENGADIFTTLDVNLQRKAEEVLKESVRRNTNANGGPRTGGILVMDVETGAILASATYPEFDPNKYADFSDAGYTNSLINVPYEVGSVIKPLTVATALNEWKTDSRDAKGNRLGVPSDWAFSDYSKQGKPYQEVNGNVRYIGNAQGVSYKDLGPQSLSNCLRDSINTCMAEITDEVSGRKIQEYYLERFRLGKSTQVKFSGYSPGNARLIENNLGCPFCFATHSFGQGFSISALQLARSYTALANDGVLVEPYLIDRIMYHDGTVDDGTGSDSIIQRSKSGQPVILPEVARLVTGYMVNTANQGYQGNGVGKGAVSGYTVAGKSGTAQIARQFDGKPCNYDCNTAKGLYDHTFVGYGPEKDPQILVLSTLSEPKPGEVENFSSDTVGPSFAEMMEFSLEYIGVPRNDRG